MIKNVQSYIMPTYGQTELEFVRGEGVYLYSAENKKFLDFGSGIAVNSLGHCHPKLVSVLKDQASKLWHTSNLYYSSAKEKYAELLRFIKQKHPNPVSEYTPSTQTEASLRDLVYDAKKTHLPDASVEKELNVFTELDVDVKVDLYIQHQDQLTIYECKKDATRVLDLYQLTLFLLLLKM